MFGFFLPLNIQYIVLSIYIRIFFTSKLRKIKRKDKEIKNNNFILRKMFIAGLELTIPDSGGQCAKHCATKALQLDRVIVLFIDNRYL